MELYARLKPGGIIGLARVPITKVMGLLVSMHPVFRGYAKDGGSRSSMLHARSPMPDALRPPERWRRRAPPDAIKSRDAAVKHNRGARFWPFPQVTSFTKGLYRPPFPPVAKVRTLVVKNQIKHDFLPNLRGNKRILSKRRGCKTSLLSMPI